MMFGWRWRFAVTKADVWKYIDSHGIGITLKFFSNHAPQAKKYLGFCGCSITTGLELEAKFLIILLKVLFFRIMGKTVKRLFVDLFGLNHCELLNYSYETMLLSIYIA